MAFSPSRTGSPPILTSPASGKEIFPVESIWNSPERSGSPKTVTRMWSPVPKTYPTGSPVAVTAAGVGAGASPPPPPQPASTKRPASAAPIIHRIVISFAPLAVLIDGSGRPPQHDQVAPAPLLWL